MVPSLGPEPENTYRAFCVELHAASVPLCDVSTTTQLRFYCRTAEELMLYLGGKVGYWRGDIKGLVDDIGQLF